MPADDAHVSGNELKLCKLQEGRALPVQSAGAETRLCCQGIPSTWKLDCEAVQSTTRHRAVCWGCNQGVLPRPSVHLDSVL